MTRFKNSVFYRHYYPWIVWSLGALYLFYKYLLETSPSVLGASLMRDFALTGTQLGNLAASYFYAYLIMQIPMGIFTDRFGPRKVTTLCILTCVAGTLLFAFSPNLFLAEVGRFITGVGAAVAALSCLKLTTLWFPPKRFPLMAGLMMCWAMLGAVFAEAPLSIVLSHLDWRHAMFYCALLGLVFAGIYWLSVRDEGPHAPELYALPDEKVPVFAGIKEILKDPQTWLLSLYSGLAFAPVSVFGGLWGVPYLQEAFGFTRTTAAEQVSWIFIGFAIGAPIWGWVSDMLGRRLPLMIGGTILALVFASIVIYSAHLTEWQCGILLFLFGLFISAFLLCFTMVCQVNRLILAATAIGFMNSFDALLGAISDPFIGKILDAGWKGKIVDGARIFSLSDYHLGLSAITLYLLIALILTFFIKETFRSQKP